MKNLKRVIVATLLFAITLLNVQAQDVITLKNGKAIEGKITEITDIAIRYYDYGDEDQLTFTLDRALIDKIEFQSGKKMKEIPPTIIDENYFSGDRKHMMKLNFSALGGNALIVSYERSLKPEYAVESNLKMIGLGIGEEDISGLGMDIGIKFKTKGIFKKSGEYRPRHLLAGGYMKPALGLNAVKLRGESKTFGNFGIDFGKQWIFANKFSVDAFMGWHYVLGNGKLGDNGYDEYRSRAVQTGDLAGYGNHAVTYGLKIGYLFNTEKRK